jgi:hypothetical protein
LAFSFARRIAISMLELLFVLEERDGHSAAGERNETKRAGSTL